MIIERARKYLKPETEDQRQKRLKNTVGFGHKRKPKSPGLMMSWRSTMKRQKDRQKEIHHINTTIRTIQGLPRDNTIRAQLPTLNEYLKKNGNRQ